MFGYSPWELFVKGGIVMWPLLACCIAAVAIIAERLLVLFFSANPTDKLLATLTSSLAQREVGKAQATAIGFRGPVANVAIAYLNLWDQPEALRQEVVNRTVTEEIGKLETRLSWLAVLAQVTPLLGLLGTVIGLMAAFQVLDTKGTSVKSADLATGIWQKLLNTSFGLAIAIPCLLIYFAIEARISRIQDDMNRVISHLNEWHLRLQIPPLSEEKS